MSNDTLIVVVVIGAIVYYIRSLLGKVDKLENEVKTNKTDSEVIVNEERVKQLASKAISSLERYRALKNKQGSGSDPKKPN